MNLRQAWTGFVTPEDYELHMASIGQAQANAVLVREAVINWAAAGARLWIAGAGTGQMFDFASAAFLSPFDVTFSDINAQFLERLEARLAQSGLTQWRTQLDDLEQTALAGPFDMAAVVLVFEHIAWRKGIASIAKVAPARCLIVIQQNPAGMTAAVTPSRVPPGTMKAVVAAKPVLVDEAELIAEMATKGYRELERTISDVPDGKKMLALVFESNRRFIDRIKMRQTEVPEE